MFGLFKKKEKSIDDYIDGKFGVEAFKVVASLQNYFSNLEGWENKTIRIEKIAYLMGFLAYAALFEANKTQEQSNIISTEIVTNFLKQYNKQYGVELTNDNLKFMMQDYARFMTACISLYSAYLNKTDLNSFSYHIFETMQSEGNITSDGYLENMLTLIPFLSSLKADLRDLV